MQLLGEEGIDFPELLFPGPWSKLLGLSILKKDVGLHPLPLAKANMPWPGLVGAGNLRPPLPLILFITMFPALPIGIYSSLSSLLCLSMLVSLSAMSLLTSLYFSFDVSKVTQNDIITLTPLVNYPCVVNEL